VLAKTDQVIGQALQQFATAVAAKSKGLAAGEPEDQLRGPLENFLASTGQATDRNVVAKGESLLEGRIGRPDYAVLVDKLLAGYIELKAPGKGANPDHYKGADRAQWKRFQCLPNLIYTDGNEWTLYRNGQRVGDIVRLSGNIAKSGVAAVKPDDAFRLKPLLVDFLAWDPDRSEAGARVGCAPSPSVPNASRGGPGRVEEPEFGVRATREGLARRPLLGRRR
jgi:hypothetical protein